MNRLDDQTATTSYLKLKLNMIKHISVFCFILMFIATSGSADSLQCKDENNQPVDWYVMYKLPKLKGNDNPSIKRGVSYLYITSDSVDSGWKLSSKSITAQDSIPGNTLNPLYDNKTSEKSAWVVYNDAPPNKQWSAKYGHTKGVVMADINQGFWLIHSVPNFPPAPNAGQEVSKRLKNNNINEKSQNPIIPDGEYSYPSSGTHYGQSFLCISLNSDQFDIVGKQLMYNQIVVYKRNIPKNLRGVYPVFANATNQMRIKTAPFTNEASIKSLKSMKFISFAKSDKWQKDLYDEFVAPTLKSNLFVETWLNGRGRLPSDCHGLKVNNIKSIALESFDVQFNSSMDHSKWAVASDNERNKNWICIGDINRADTQYVRGGGTVCFNLSSIWKIYKDAITDVEPCPLFL